MKVRKISMSTKIFIFVALLLLLSDLCIGSVFYERAKNLLVEQMKDNAVNIAKCASATIDGAEYRTIAIGDTSSATYNHLYDQLVMFRDNSDIEYIYTLNEADNTVVYVVDTALDNPADSGDDFGAFDDTIKAALNGTPGIDDEPYTDEWALIILLMHLSSTVQKLSALCVLT